MPVTALVPYYGSARMIAQHVGEAVAGCPWVGIPFAGGMCEVLAMKSARTIVVNDLHHHIINLARCVSNIGAAAHMQAILEGTLIHPAELAEQQNICRYFEEHRADYDGEMNVDWAVAYFICSWLTRNGTAGTLGELTGNLCLRWESSGGDSGVRFRSAIESISAFRDALFGRATFSTLAAFDDGEQAGPFFLGKCKDRKETAIYCDPPFLDAGLKYSHAPKKQTQHAWHRMLAARLNRFEHARVIVRAYDIPAVRELYNGWEFRQITGRKQTNAKAAELLVIKNG